MGQGNDALSRFDNVSRETLDKLEQYETLLRKWNPRINLVHARTLDEFWTRHAADCWQITPFIPASTKTAIDLGSGGGFPGIIVSILLNKNGSEVYLTESVSKKCAFLREVIRELGLNAKVMNKRIEDIAPFKAEVVTARAFAPLPSLLNYASAFMGEESRAILLKGREWQAEIDAAKAEFDFDVQTHPSHTDEEGRILIVKNLKRKSDKLGDRA